MEIDNNILNIFINSIFNLEIKSTVLIEILIKLRILNSHYYSEINRILKVILDSKKKLYSSKSNFQDIENRFLSYYLRYLFYKNKKDNYLLINHNLHKFNDDDTVNCMICNYILTTNEIYIVEWNSYCRFLSIEEEEKNPNIYPKINQYKWCVDNKSNIHKLIEFNISNLKLSACTDCYKNIEYVNPDSELVISPVSEYKILMGNRIPECYQRDKFIDIIFSNLKCSDICNMDVSTTIPKRWHRRYCPVGEATKAKCDCDKCIPSKCINCGCSYNKRLEINDERICFCDVCSIRSCTL